MKKIARIVVHEYADKHGKRVLAIFHYGFNDYLDEVPAELKIIWERSLMYAQSNLRRCIKLQDLCVSLEARRERERERKRGCSR